MIFCIIDDLRAEHFFEYVNKGYLPNFKKLVENGISSKNCITDFPSITYPTQVSMLTGTYTGDYRKELCHAVPMYNWIGRDLAPPVLRCYGSNDLQIYKMNGDLGPNCRTLLEMAGDGNKTSITQFINRGTDYFFPESKAKLIFYYLLLKNSRNPKKMMSRANFTVVSKLLDNFKNPKRYFESREPPIASLIWFMSSDIVMHYFGYDSLFYKANLMCIDRIIGILMESLKDLGYLDDTAIAITADHGNYKAKKVGNLFPFLNRSGLNQFNFRKNPTGNLDLAEYSGIGFFNFKGSSKTSNKYGWSRPTVKELENFGPKRLNMYKELFKIEGSSMMYHRDDSNLNNKGMIHLKRKVDNSGKYISGRIEYRGANAELQTCYIADGNDGDVFGYGSDDKASKILDGKFHTLKEWEVATYHLDYTMYPDLIVRHFKNPRSCDIILSNDGSVTYNIEHGIVKKEKRNIIYTHDLGVRKCQIVPLLIGGSHEIPHLHVNYCKTTDIVPTLLKMIGKKPHKSVVGDSLI